MSQSTSDKKRSLRAERRRLLAEFRQAHAGRSCFWDRPLGHIWGPWSTGWLDLHQTVTYRECEVCGKRQVSI